MKVRAPLVVAALLAAGCLDGDLDLVGRACPCPSHLICDQATNRCVERAPNDRDGSLPSDTGANGQPDGGGPRDNGPGADAAENPDVFVPDAIVPDGGPGTCSIDGECGDPTLICEQMRCIRRCDAPGAACTGSDVCNRTSGRCVPGNLPLGSMCSLNAQCNTDLCLTITGPRPMSFCSDPCGRTGDCPIGFGCRTISDMAFCVPPSIQEPPAAFQTPSGGACMDAELCQSQVCNTTDMVCVERCSRDSDCAGFGDNCWLWIQNPTTNPIYGQICLPQTGAGPGEACTMNSNCASGLCSRYTNTCAELCCADLDCPVGQTCAVYDHDPQSITKICRALSAGNGMRGVGQPCTADLECVTEVCVPEDASMPMGPKVCSTTCCNDDDCNILEANARCWPARGPLTGTLVGVCLPP